MLVERQVPEYNYSWKQAAFVVVSSGRFGGGRSSVVSASEFKSADPGFDLLAEQAEGQYFCAQNVCAR